jgi:tRNA-splicing ligase RtcB
LTADEVIDVARQGFPAVARKFGFGADAVQRVENGGTMGEPLPRDVVEELLRGASPSLLRRWQVRLGLSLGGNHFVEIQRVVKVHDPGVAGQWGLEPGQVIVMYHGGGGPLAGFMGRYFGNRTKDPAKKRAELFVKKLRYHFGAEGALEQAPARLKYFSPMPFTRQRADTAEGQRLARSIAIGMNYGYAYRLAIASRIARSLEEAFAASSVKTDLVYDLSHNSIQRERVGNQMAWVHRHNSCRVDGATPVLIPGMYNSTSFLTVGAESADRFLRSAPHGLGELVSRDQQEGAASAVRSETLRLDGRNDQFTTVPHISSPRMTTALERMEAEGLLRRVVEMAPVAVLKNFRG